MDIYEPGWPLIDDFFERLAEGRKATTVRRYARVRHRLYDFLDTDDMGEWLRPSEVTLLAAEREFRRDGALYGLFGVDGLLRCLPGFVAESQVPTGAAEARMQISVVDRLLLHLRMCHLVPRASLAPLVAAKRATDYARVDLEARLRPRSPELQAFYDQIDAAHPRPPHPVPRDDM
jgi:hypothetical protein